MSIASEISRLQTAKADIKTAIEAKGVTVPSSTTIDGYSELIDDIPTGGGSSGNPLLTSIDVDDFTGTVFSYAVSYITNVTIPSGVTNINGSAFEKAHRLTEVTIPSSVTSIGNDSFRDCSNLTSVTIPENVTYLGARSFYGCTSLHTVTFNAISPNDFSNSNISHPFYGCTNLRTVNIGQSCERIPNYFMSQITSLRTIPVLNYGNIGDYAFYGCTGLTSVTITGVAGIIGIGAFRNCSNITGITLQEGIFQIKDNAFRGCSNITSITLPSTVEQLGGWIVYETGVTSFTCLATTPPTITNNTFYNSTFPIYVPAASVDAYKTATNWSSYASRIQAIPE